jgi:hypothetical protein
MNYEMKMTVFIDELETLINLKDADNAAATSRYTDAGLSVCVVPACWPGWPTPPWP